MNKRLLLRTRAVCAAAFLLLAIPGCLSDSNDENDSLTPGPCASNFQLQRNSVEKTIGFLEIVWGCRLYPEYEGVLHDQFEFFPLERNATDFPWMTGPSWNRTEELNIAFHMFDPSFSGQQSPVDVIEIELPS